MARNGRRPLGEALRPQQVRKWGPQSWNCKKLNSADSPVSSKEAPELQNGMQPTSTTISSGETLSRGPRLGPYRSCGLSFQLPTAW